MAIGAGSAAAGASTAGEAVTTIGKTFANGFAMTAKDNFVHSSRVGIREACFVVS